MLAGVFIGVLDGATRGIDDPVSAAGLPLDLL